MTAVSHANVVIHTAAGANEQCFFSVSPTDQTESTKTKLTALVETLNAVRVPQHDVIDIIKSLDRMGKLRGRLIIE